VSATPFTVVIPARYASTRFPGKPLIDLGGKPMVVRVAERAALSGATAVVIATDDQRIAQACIAHGFQVQMTRTYHATGTDRLSEVASALELADEDIVVNVQGDEPLIPPNVIALAAQHLAASVDASIATLCHRIHDVADVVNPNVVKCVMNEAGEALYFSRAPIPFDRDHWRPEALTLDANFPVYRHIGLYAYKARFLRAFPALAVPAIERAESLEQLRALAHGFRIAVLKVDEPLPAGVDTPDDYLRMKRQFG
jgi:3-deoxy-manno-octulosonate cytidylyltransferase (CMP-KDO synthetase)